MHELTQGHDVRDHIPLEQGLRPFSNVSGVYPDVVRDHIPLEQGLRLYPTPPLKGLLMAVRDHIPLEQGLRQRPKKQQTDVQLSETIFH